MNRQKLFKNEIDFTYVSNTLQTHVVDDANIKTEKIVKEMELLRDLCQAMFDPENQPPQYSVEDAWNIFLKVTK